MMRRGAGGGRPDGSDAAHEQWWLDASERREALHGWRPCPWCEVVHTRQVSSARGSRAHKSGRHGEGGGAHTGGDGPQHRDVEDQTGTRAPFRWLIDRGAAARVGLTRSCMQRASRRVVVRGWTGGASRPPGVPGWPLQGGGPPNRSTYTVVCQATCTYVGQRFDAPVAYARSPRGGVLRRRGGSPSDDLPNLWSPPLGTDPQRWWAGNCVIYVTLRITAERSTFTAVAESAPTRHQVLGLPVAHAAG
jgi:hypothetical protein